jgi:hypothetical protein
MVRPVWKRWRLGIAICGALLLTPMFSAAEVLIGESCPDTSCSAGGLDPVFADIGALLDICDGSPGDTYTAVVQFNALGGSPIAYDLGFWIEEPEEGFCTVEDGREDEGGWPYPLAQGFSDEDGDGCLDADGWVTLASEAAPITLPCDACGNVWITWERKKDSVCSGTTDIATKTPRYCVRLEMAPPAFPPPSIDIRKQGEGPDSRSFPLGSDVPFEIVVTNTGYTDHTNVAVTDILVPDCDRVIGDLAAGETVVYSCTSPNVTASFTNEVCVTGEVFNCVQVGDCDHSTALIEDFRCTRTWGYWHTHSKYGPAPYDDTWALLPSGADTPFFGTGLTYYEILRFSSAGGNRYIGLAHQYIAAEFNVLSGAAIPSDMAAAWLEAQGLLIAYQADLDIPERTGDWQLAVELEFLLDQYNSGVVGPGHCPE